VFGLGDNLGASGHATEVMSSVAVVAFDGNGMLFADNMAFWWQYFGKSIPIIGVKSAFGEMLYFVVEASESCSITTAQHPGHGSP